MYPIVTDNNFILETSPPLPLRAGPKTALTGQQKNLNTMRLLQRLGRKVNNSDKLETFFVMVRQNYKI